MERFSHISGHPILDLLNTGGRLLSAERDETLDAYADVLDWTTETGLLTPSDAAILLVDADANPCSAREELEAVVALREATHAALMDADADAAAHVGRRHREALGRSRLQFADSGSGWQWQDERLTLTSPRDRIARGLMELLQRGDLDRLHRCEDDVCGWVFLDTSPRGNRRWCATNTCGDRNRSRAYYARKKASLR